jgi:murein DD-endopeptidase MepM/ murein hydrolase activator NlpD
MSRGSSTLVAVVAAFAAGAAVDSWLRVYGPPQPASRSAPGELQKSPEPREAFGPPEPPKSREPRETGLVLPLDGMRVDQMKGGFAELRNGHPHEAVDLLAPRNAPVYAVSDGTIAKLFTSGAGGLTIYQFDPDQRLCFYYAHLERYAAGLSDGMTVRQGQVIGYVGTSGNAPRETPHLHFAVFELGPEKHWWEGKAIDPYEMFKDRGKG